MRTEARQYGLVVCWRSAKRLLSQRLIRVEFDATLEDVFDSHVKPRLADHGSSLPVHMNAKSTASEKTEAWKDVEMTENVSLLIDFGCRFVKFSLQDAVDEEVSIAKRPCPDGASAFKVLMTSATARDRLPEEENG